MKSRFRSILSRIIWLHALALAIAAVAMPLATYLLLNTTANDFENRTLQNHAATIAQYLYLDTNGHWRLDLPQDLQTFYTHGFDGFAYSIVDNDNTVLFTSLRGRPNNLEGGTLSNSPSYFHHSNHGATYYGATIPVARDGRIARIKVGQNLEHPDVIVDDIVTGFLIRVAWFTVPIMVLLLVIDIAIVRRALKPVAEASRMAEAIDPARIDVRLPTAAVPREILPLVEAVNQALDRLETGFRLQRDFTADAAHELRTPLAVLRARVDSFDDPGQLADLRADVELMTRIVNQLLDVAELESIDRDSNEIVDLRAVCAHVVRSMATVALASSKSVALTTAISPVLIRGNSLMLTQALSNLVDNAVRHTPQGTIVEVTLDDQAAVSVADAGAGIPPDEQNLVFRRFWRRDRNRRGGSGLGLSIVARIVELHNGTVEVKNNPSGGAVFTMRFKRHFASSTSIGDEQNGDRNAILAPVL